MHAARWVWGHVLQIIFAWENIRADASERIHGKEWLAKLLFANTPRASFSRADRAPNAWPRMEARIQVITDIDDTIKSSGGLEVGGIYLGGVDKSVTRSSFYPGVFQFGLELASGSTLSANAPEPIAVLTARAEELKVFLEIKPSSKLCVRYREAGEAQGLRNWGVGPVLYGSVQEWICQERKGWRKFENFKLLQMRSAKKMQYVFVGDNGKSEKDLEAVRMMIESFPGLMRAVFIHAVSDDTQPAPLPEDEFFKGVPIYYYRTYAIAALKAAKIGLISNAGLNRVCEAIEIDMVADPVNFGRGSANDLLLREEILLAKSNRRSERVGDAISVLTQPMTGMLNSLRNALLS